MSLEDKEAYKRDARRRPYTPDVKDDLTPEQRENHRKMVEEIFGKD